MAVSFAETPAQSSTKVGTTRAFTGYPKNPPRIISELNDAKYLILGKTKSSCGSRANEWLALN
ncbi:MAG: hypothetical protein ACREYC_24465, partial [Gammaproteobacteria bacterium]